MRGKPAGNGLPAMFRDAKIELPPLQSELAWFTVALDAICWRVIYLRDFTRHVVLGFLIVRGGETREPNVKANS